VSAIGIGLFCGANDSFSPDILAAAATLGEGVAKRGWRLVYGGSQAGLMGRASRAAMASGGEVVGIIPHGLVRAERASGEITELIRVNTLAERKQVICDHADAFVAMPGGLGTIDELVEMMSWNYIGVHDKVTYLVNLKGFWTPLLDLFRHLDRNGALRPQFHDTFRAVPDMPALFAALDQRFSRPG
jgi:uncharacterized protein (TIGR00730 family)